MKRISCEKSCGNREEEHKSLIIVVTKAATNSIKWVREQQQTSVELLYKVR